MTAIGMGSRGTLDFIEKLAYGDEGTCPTDTGTAVNDSRTTDFLFVHLLQLNVHEIVESFHLFSILRVDWHIVLPRSDLEVFYFPCLLGLSRFIQASNLDFPFK